MPLNMMEALYDMPLVASAEKYWGKVAEAIDEILLDCVDDDDEEDREIYESIMARIGTVNVSPLAVWSCDDGRLFIGIPESKADPKLLHGITVDADLLGPSVYFVLLCNGEPVCMWNTWFLTPDGRPVEETEFVGGEAFTTSHAEVWKEP